MGAVWADEARLGHWLEIEILVAEALAGLGVIPDADAREIRAKASFDGDRVAEVERVTKHDVAAFVQVVADSVGSAGRWVHFGLTSSDVLDTGLALQLRDASDLLLGALERLLAVAKRLALAQPRRRDGRPHPRRRRRADQLRPQGRALGVRARPGPRPVAAGARDRERRRDQRGGRHVRAGRSARRGGGVREARSARRRGLEPDRRARPSRRAHGGARHHRLHARRDRDRDPPPRPDRGPRGPGAVHDGAEGFERDAPQAEPRPVRARHRSRARDPRQPAGGSREHGRSGTSATSRTRRPSA